MIFGPFLNNAIPVQKQVPRSCLGLRDGAETPFVQVEEVLWERINIGFLWSHTLSPSICCWGDGKVAWSWELRSDPECVVCYQRFPETPIQASPSASTMSEKVVLW